MNLGEVDWSLSKTQEYTKLVIAASEPLGYVSAQKYPQSREVYIIKEIAGRARNDEVLFRFPPPPSYSSASPTL